MLCFQRSVRVPASKRVQSRVLAETSTPRVSVGRATLQQAGAEWTGAEWTGAEWTGAEWTGVRWGMALVVLWVVVLWVIVCSVLAVHSLADHRLSLPVGRAQWGSSSVVGQVVCLLLPSVSWVRAAVWGGDTTLNHYHRHHYHTRGLGEALNPDCQAQSIGPHLTFPSEWSGTISFFPHREAGLLLTISI